MILTQTEAQELNEVFHNTILADLINRNLEISEQELATIDNELEEGNLPVGEMSVLEKLFYTLHAQVMKSYQDIVDEAKLALEPMITNHEVDKYAKTVQQRLDPLIAQAEMLNNVLWDAIRERIPAKYIHLGLRQGYQIIDATAEYPRGLSSAQEEYEAYAGTKTLANIILGTKP